MGREEVQLNYMPQKCCVPRYMDPKPPERVRSPTNPGTPTPPKERRRDCNDGTGAGNHTSASAVVRPKFLQADLDAYCLTQLLRHVGAVIATGSISRTVQAALDVINVL